jgi:hypothetical protein
MKKVFGIDPTEFAKDEAKQVEKPKAASETVQNSLYLPRSTLKLLKRIALDEDLKVHDLFIEGIDTVLKKRGYPSVAEAKSGRP